MLLKVLMDFCSLKIRDKPHAPTHTLIIIIIIKYKIIKQQYNSRAEHLVRCMHLLRIKRQLQNYFSKITYDSKAVCFNGSIMKLM